MVIHLFLVELWWNDCLLFSLVISVRFLCHFRSLSWDDKTAAVAAFIYLFIFFRLVSGCFGSFSLFHSVISVAFQFHFLPIPISLAFQPDSSEKTGNASFFHSFLEICLEFVPFQLQSNLSEILATLYSFLDWFSLFWFLIRQRCCKFLEFAWNSFHLNSNPIYQKFWQCCTSFCYIFKKFGSTVSISPIFRLILIIRIIRTFNLATLHPFFGIFLKFVQLTAEFWQRCKNFG